jgi:hypothetical protein
VVSLLQYSNEPSGSINGGEFDEFLSFSGRAVFSGVAVALTTCIQGS